MAFKSIKKGNQQKTPDGNEINKFIAQASGETQDSNEEIKQSIKSATKSFVVQMDESIHKRLKNYRNTEAKKIETHNYIVNVAVDAWLREKGF